MFATLMTDCNLSSVRLSSTVKLFHDLDTSNLEKEGPRTCSVHNKLRRFFDMILSTKTFAVFAAILGLTLTFLISGVALGQNAGQSNPGDSGASGAVNPGTIDDATVKQTAKA